ncbi:hypothetical protein KY334_00860 [Candidatus Woesearchaeota archaeon]|nr:hypothetical protein [Candidatus Woesearchaeota archaeon]
MDWDKLNKNYLSQNRDLMNLQGKIIEENTDWQEWMEPNSKGRYEITSLNFIKNPSKLEDYLMEIAQRELILKIEDSYGNKDTQGDEDGDAVLMPALYEVINNEKKLIERKIREGTGINNWYRKEICIFCIRNLDLRNRDKAPIIKNLQVLVEYEDEQPKYFNVFEKHDRIWNIK